jgi:hypothetical protein
LATYGRSQPNRAGATECLHKDFDGAEMHDEDDQPARTTASKSHAAIKWNQLPVHGAASGSSKRAVSAGADDIEADPPSLIGSVICGEVCIRGFSSWCMRACAASVLSTEGHDKRKPHAQASMKLRPFYRRLIFDSDFSRSSSANKSPVNGAVGILITNTISLFCFIFSSTSAKSSKLSLEISDPSSLLG